MSHALLNIDRQILEINQVICRNIGNIEDSERGFVAQNVLAQLRNFVEHIMLKVWRHPNDAENSYENICKAIEYVKTRGEYRFLRRFHDYLQIVASHYTLDGETSERLMLKYYEFLLKIRSSLKKSYTLDVLQNLHTFPISTDPGLQEYHERIAAALDNFRLSAAPARKDRYYIHRIKPFFVDEKIYYEVTFTSTNVNASKFDRVIAFTALDVSAFYAAKLSIVEASIAIMGKTMPIMIIADWEVSIRPCEIDNFSRILGVNPKASSGDPEYRELMRFLTTTGFNLVDVIDFPATAYVEFTQQIANKADTLKFLPILDRCREMVKNKRSGSNVIRYLLFRLNNTIIKSQTERGSQNAKLSNLYLKNGCIPFDEMPFNTSLINHNPKIADLLNCLSSENREHELLARFIKNNTEIRGCLYTPIKEASEFGDLKILIDKYNGLLWFGHSGRKIKEFHDHLYISDYEDNTLIALRRLKELASSGVANYSNSVNSWLKSNVHHVDCEEKKQTLVEMFERSRVALIYGPAGTGKSTIINHISHYFSNYKKLFLANTNPAIDNLKRRVDAANCEYSTIAKFLMKNNVSTDYDLLIIDECSTVSNQDIRDVVAKAQFKLLVLVGDIYQIESIRFGNWFSAARSFIPMTSVFELTKPYRSQCVSLLELWGKVRRKDDTIVEHIARNGYSCNLDKSIFEQTKDEEIILCLHYDGLYGVNNINRFLQQSNPHPAAPWDVHKYKVNDPILFNESNRFAPLIYNNMKGRIVGIEVLPGGNVIQFDIELDKAISGLDAEPYDFTLRGNSERGNSVIRFTANKYKATDEDDDNSGADVVPFQVAYAVSIHKAQGLEYESVKIVITDETDELITHNIFYTAITRARNKLKIYWSPEVEKRVLEGFKSKTSNKDVALLKLYDPTLASATSP